MKLTRRIGGLLAGVALIWVGMSLTAPLVISQVPTNAISRALLQTGTFVLAGIYKITGQLYVPAGNSLPGTCDASLSGTRRMFINLSDNTMYLCTATNTWTSIGSGALSNPYALNQTFSGTVNFTGTTEFPRGNVINVCKTGCTYSSINSALSTLVGVSTSTNRYTILVWPGDYDETVSFINGTTPINYVTIRGTDRNAVRIRGASASGTVRTQTKDATGNALENITIGGSIPVLLNGLFGTGATRTTFYMTNVILGIIDGSENSAAGKSIDGFVSSNNAKNRDIYLSNSICYSTFDCVRPQLDETLYAYSNLYIIDDLGQTQRAEPYSLSQGGAQIYDVGSTTFLRRSVDSAGAGVGGYGLVMGPTTAGGTRPTVVNLQSCRIYISSYGAATNGKTLACLYLDPTPALQAGSYVLFKDVDCRVEDSSNTWHVRGIGGSGNDADYANLTVRWEGGSIVRSGGVDSYDVEDLVTQAGFGIAFNSVRHAGSYTGAGIANFNFGDVQGGGFGNLLRGPVADLAVGACTQGEVKTDTGGATKEYCICGTTNTWGCWKLTDGTFNANGPAD